ncbi:hypothetical protein GGR50DRAFT_705367 [Xylaria sp. CBS 124048]|nr:hypothetical protein GGR50DRAFT_705367 [Xylaria sp. CBS 124048]
MEIETLLPQMQDVLSKIQATITGLNPQKQHEEIEQLEQKREQLLSDLKSKYEKEQQEIAARRQAELENIKQKRKQEDEKREARRRKEDEEFKLATSNEDMERRQKLESEASSLERKLAKQKEAMEEANRKAIQEGKQRLHDLDEKRKELNRLIDEELQQPEPRPARKRHRSKPQPGDPPKGETTGGHASNGSKGDDSGSKGDDSTPSANNTPPDPSPQKQAPSADPPAKAAPDGKVDGELPPHQATSGITTQAAEKPAGDLPTPPVAAKNNVSNESKGKRKLEEPSSGRPEQDEGRRDTRGSDEAEHVKRREREKENKETENGKLPPGREHVPGKTDNQGRREASNEEKSTLIQSSARGPENDMHPKDQGSASNKDNSPTHQAEGDIYTVESQPALQPPGLSSSPEKRASGQDSKPHDQVGLDQTAIPDLPERGHSGIDRGTRKSLRGPQSSDQVSKSRSAAAPSRSPNKGQREHDQPGKSAAKNCPFPASSQKRPLSPLPVENQTVCGHEQLFDDDRQASATSESDPTDERVISPPNTPVNGYDLPVHPEPVIIPESLEEIAGLKELIGDFGSSPGVLTGETSKDSSASSLVPDKTASSREGGETMYPVRRTIEKTRTEDGKRGESRGRRLPEIERTRRQSARNRNRSSPGHFESPSYVISSKGDHARPRSRHTPHFAEISDDLRRPRHRKESPPILLSDSGVEGSPRHANPRGRRMHKSFRSRERAVNPREEMFRGCHDDINIRGDWFMRSKRGLS